VKRAGLVAAVALAGCSHGRSGPVLGAGAPVPETRDELLVATGDAVWRGDLTAAHATLTRLADRERGMADSALDFWSRTRSPCPSGTSGSTSSSTAGCFTYSVTTTGRVTPRALPRR